MQGLEEFERYPIVLSFSRYVLAVGWGDMLCRDVGDADTGGETLRGGVRGSGLQRSETDVLTSSPMALRMGLQLLIAWGSGGQQTGAPPPHIAPA